VLCADEPGQALDADLPQADESFHQGKLNAVRAIGSSKYWLGVHCDPVESVLRTHLKLHKGQGLIVRDVVPDGPAARAGIHTHDIFLVFRDDLLIDVATLVEAVENAGETASDIQIIREGEQQLVTVVPEKRPSRKGSTNRVTGRANEIDELLKKYQHFLPGDVRHQLEGQLRRSAEEPFRFRFIYPGGLLKHWQEAMSIELPKDLSITIQVQGGDPAKITVRQDDQQWDVTEENLNSLPPDVQHHVERLLAWRLPMVNWREGKWAMGGWRTNPQSINQENDIEVVEESQGEVVSEPLERRLDRFQNQLEKLQKSIEELGNR
tara:strand:+ start:156 stop:1121 length:966 start_codon:yes stop_codon:yes gene_type:complete